MNLEKLQDTKLMHRNNLHSYTLTTREEQYGGFLKIKIDLPFDQATPLLGIYPEKTIIQKDTCTPNVHCSSIYNSQEMEAT